MCVCVCVYLCVCVCMCVCVYVCVCVCEAFVVFKWVYTFFMCTHLCAVYEFVCVRLSVCKDQCSQMCT